MCKELGVKLKVEQYVDEQQTFLPFLFEARLLTGPPRLIKISE